MPRSYFRTLPDLYERKVFGTDHHPPYPAAALACFIGVLCFGEQQPERGRFKSRRVLVALLEGPHGVGRTIAREVPYLIRQGDLVEQPDGSLYIEGWDELQEGNWQVAERMSRYRARIRSVTVHTVTPSRSNGGPVTDAPSRVVSGRRLAVEGELEAAPLRALTPRQAVHAWLSEHGAAAPVGWVNTTLNEYIKVYGSSAIIACWLTAPPDVRTSKQYVQHMERSLAPNHNGQKPVGGHTRTAQEGEDAFS